MAQQCTMLANILSLFKESHYQNKLGNPLEGNIKPHRQENYNSVKSWLLVRGATHLKLYFSYITDRDIACSVRDDSKVIY